MSDIETNIVFHPDSNLLKRNYKPLVAQFNLTNSTLLRSNVPRYDNIFSKNNKAKIPRLKPPYRKRDLDRFEDCFRSDGSVRNALTKKWNFILGAHTFVSLDVDREFQDDDLRAQAFQQVVAYEPYKKAMDVANEVLRRVNFRKIIVAAGIQASVYGRACIEKVRDPSTGKIVRLNVLNSKLLGDVEVNKDTWEFLGVHYRDLPKHDDLLYAEDIIYISRHDYHISSGSMYYGLSDLEPVIDGSETKRVIKQEDLKEISKALWAGFGWMQFNDPNITQEQMEAIVNNLKAGAWTATDNQVTLEVKEIAQNAPMLLEIINEMNLETSRDLEVPSPLVGYENKQNYSNLVQTLIAWKESTLDAERRWLKDIIENQLLKEIYKRSLEEQGIQCPPDGQDLVSERVVQVQNDQPLNPLQPNGMLINQTQIIPPAKLSYDIEDPDFTPYKEKMEIDLQLYNKRLISARKILERAGMEDQIEETEMRLREDEIKAQQMQQFQQEVFNQHAQASNRVFDKRNKLLDKLEGTLGSLEMENGDDNQKTNNRFPPNKKPY